MFSFIAKFIDTTRLSFHERSRFDELRKIYTSSLRYMGMSFFLILFVILASVIVWYKGQRPTPSKFFMVPPASVLQKNPEKPLSEQIKELSADTSPRMSNFRVREWVMQSVSQILNLDFAHYNEQIEASRILFDPDTFEKFKASMLSRGALGSSINENRLISYFVPMGNPVLVRAGSMAGVRIWEFDTPGLIVVTGAIKEDGRAPEVFTVRTAIYEVPPSVSPYGIVIKIFNMKNGLEVAEPPEK